MDLLAKRAELEKARDRAQAQIDLLDEVIAATTPMSMPSVGEFSPCDDCASPAHCETLTAACSHK